MAGVKIAANLLVIPRIEREMFRFLPLDQEPAEFMYRPMRDYPERGGKRARPALVLLSCEALGGDVQGALLTAAAFEMFQSFALLHDDIEDDSVGVYGPLFKELGMEGKRQYDRLMLQLLLNGFNSVCFDGQYFFDTDHPVGAGTASNAVVTAFDATAYAAARTAMLEFKDDRGRPLSIVPNLLVVGTANEAAARGVVIADTGANGATNPWKGSAELLVLPGLGTKWFLLDTSRAVKPFLLQIRKAPQLVSQVTPEADSVFNRATFKYSAESRCNAGYGLWQQAYGSTGAGQ